MTKLNLSAEQTAALDAAGIDWKGLLQKVEQAVVSVGGPIVMALLQQLLASLAAQAPARAAGAGKGLAGCTPHACCHAILTSALEHAALCADGCCQCEEDD